MTDIAVLVVAADDGVMPQTIEALNHAKAAEVPIIVAVNKIDKDEADPQRVRQQLVEQGVVPAEWGGEYEFVDVSAKAGPNLDNLLETILLVADLQELKADPDGPRPRAWPSRRTWTRAGARSPPCWCSGARSGSATPWCAERPFAKVRAMLDENGQPVKEAGPAKPVQVLGWSHVPEAGDEFRGGRRRAGGPPHRPGAGGASPRRRAGRRRDRRPRWPSSCRGPRGRAARR